MKGGEGENRDKRRKKLKGSVDGSTRETEGRRKKNKSKTTIEKEKKT